MAFRLLPVLLLLVAACGPTQEPDPPFNRDGGPDFSAFGLPCPKAPPDTDGDAISDHDEGADESPPRDTDNDGIPDFRDLDSDGDGIPDYIEGRNGNACTPPADSDGDGVPDFRDLDSDSPSDSTLPDRQEAGPNPAIPLDHDGDGEPDYMDTDDDGDGIPDVLEMTRQGATKPSNTIADMPDTDADGIPDYLDLDSDNDTIGDKEERFSDVDGDLVPNYRDSDSDGDCVPDVKEAGDDNLATPAVDTDKDGAPDWADTDSDNDGVTDGLEDKSCDGVLDMCETNRLIDDSDGDGASDLVEYESCIVKPVAEQLSSNCACDGRDSSITPLTRGDFVFIMTYQQAPTPDKDVLSLATDVGQADVLFVVDTTISMQTAISALSDGLTALVGKVKARVSDPAFGLFEFRDLGTPQNDPTTTPPNVPAFRYVHRLQTANSAGMTALANALMGLVARGGGDKAEAGWGALWTLSTTATRTITVIASTTYSLVTNPGLLSLSPGESGGTGAGAGFRNGSVPILVTVSDAEWHDAPGSLVGADQESGKNMYPSTDGTATPACNPCTNVPSRREAITNLQNLGARVIGLSAIGSNTFGDPKARATKLALETGAIVDPADFGPTGIRPTGCAGDKCCTGLDAMDNVIGENPLAGQCPLSFTVNGDNGKGVSDAVAAGIGALTAALRYDIHAEAHDLELGAVDNFLLRLEPNLSGAGPASMCVTSAPAPLQDKFIGPHALPGADGHDDTFPGLRGGSQVCFDILPKMNTTVMPTDKPQVFRAEVQAKGVSGSSIVNLGAPRRIVFLVPPTIVNTPIK